MTTLPTFDHLLYPDKELQSVNSSCSMHLLIESLKDVIAIVDLQGVLTYISPQSYDAIGYTPEELVNQKKIMELIEPSELSAFEAFFSELILHGKAFELHKTKLLHKQGRIIVSEANGTPIFDAQRNLLGYRVVSRDVTKKMQSEQELFTSNTQLRTELHDKSRELSAINGMLDKRLKEKEAYEHRLQIKQLSEKLLSEYARRFIKAKPEEIRGIIDEALADVGALFRVDRCYIFEHNSENTTMSNTHEWCNEGITREIDNLQDLPLDLFPYWIEKTNKQEDINLTTLNDLPSHAVNERNILEMQGIKSLFVSPLFVDTKVIGFIGFDSVNFERTWSNERYSLKFLGEMISFTLDRLSRTQHLIKAKNFYQSIFNNSIAANLILDQDYNVQDLNPRFEQLTGYQVSDFSRSLTSDYFLLEKIFGPNFLEFQAGLNHDLKLQKKDGGIIHVYLNVTSIPHLEHKLVSFIDITELRRLEMNLQESFERLNQTFLSAIYTIGKIVEISDPYTSNHQQRAATLARKIGKKLSLSESDCDTIYLSGLLHDIGKIYIPAQILNKPSKLSDIEMEMIKTHSTFSYQMIKNIEFPWPIAEIVYQHHEKQDGSGYPRGLKGPDIRIEAQILSVADIVESMSSHRPYRPALGIDTAMAEIQRQSGVTLAPQVVAACLEIIEEGQWP